MLWSELSEKQRNSFFNLVDEIMSNEDSEKETEEDKQTGLLKFSRLKGSFPRLCQLYVTRNAQLKMQDFYPLRPSVKLGDS